jgi:hypothetical protein
MLLDILNKQQIQSSISSPKGTLFAKVSDVLLDFNDDNYKNEFQPLGIHSLGSIKYQKFSNLQNNEFGFALPLRSDITNAPLIDEVVMLFYGPNYTAQQNSQLIIPYYLSDFSIYGSNQENSIPAPPSTPVYKTFVPKDKIRGLLPYEGDRIYEGRNGASIRFGTTVTNPTTKNPWSNGGNDGDPITIIRNGQYIDFDDSENIAPILEDINRDASSIYMTNNQQISIDVASKNLDTFGINLDELEQNSISIASADLSPQTQPTQEPIEQEQQSPPVSESISPPVEETQPIPEEQYEEENPSNDEEDESVWLNKPPQPIQETLSPPSSSFTYKIITTGPRKQIQVFDNGSLVYEGNPSFSASSDILKQEAIQALEDTYRAEGRIEELRQMKQQ